MIGPLPPKRHSECDLRSPPPNSTGGGSHCAIVVPDHRFHPHPPSFEHSTMPYSTTKSALKEGNYSSVRPQPADDVKPKAAPSAAAPTTTPAGGVMNPNIECSNRIDRYARVIFPSVFAVFSITYWAVYTHISYKKMADQLLWYGYCLYHGCVQHTGYSRQMAAELFRWHLLNRQTFEALPACEHNNLTSLLGRFYTESALNVRRFNVGVLLPWNGNNESIDQYWKT